MGGEEALVSLLKQPGVGFIIAGMIITVIGLYAASGGPGEAWEIMGRVIPSHEWGLPFAIVGLIFLLIGAVITYYFSFKKK